VNKSSLDQELDFILGFQGTVLCHIESVLVEQEYLGAIVQEGEVLPLPVCTRQDFVDMVASPLTADTLWVEYEECFGFFKYSLIRDGVTVWCKRPSEHVGLYYETIKDLLQVCLYGFPTFEAV
jgi:hypothetical protein